MTTELDDDDLLLNDEVALIVRKSPGTLRYYRYCGIGPASFKLGRRIVHRRSVVMAWLAEQEQADPRTPAACQKSRT